MRIMSMSVYGLVVAALVSCMPAPDADVLSFDQDACVDFGTIGTREYEALVSSLSVYPVNTRSSGNTPYLSLNRSKQAFLHALVISSRDVSADGGRADGGRNVSADRDIDDIFIKQVGSEKDTWNLDQLTSITSSSNSAVFPNTALAREMLLKQGTDIYKKEYYASPSQRDAVSSGGVNAAAKAYEDALRDALEDDSNPAIKHYAGISEDEDGKTEAHVFVATYAGGISEDECDYTSGGKEYEGDHTSGGKEDVCEEERAEEHAEEVPSGVQVHMIVLFHNGNVYSSALEELASDNYAEYDETAVNVLMPGIHNRLVGKYFTNASCSEGDTQPRVKSPAVGNGK